MKKICLYLIFSIVSALTISCAKKDVSSFEDKSGVKFRYGQTKSADAVASYKDFQIAKPMVVSQSAPLQEMMTMENDFLFTRAYEMALEAPDTGKVAMKFFLPISGKVEEVLGKNKIKSSTNVTVALEQTGTPELVASINGRPLSKGDLGSSSIEYMSLKRRQVQEIVSRVKGIVIRSEYAKLADAAKIPLEEYLKQNVYGDAGAATQPEIDQFVKESNLSEPDLTPEVKAKLGAIVEERKKNGALESHFAKKVQSEPILISALPEKLAISFSQSVNAAWGFSDAPIDIQIFSDMNCGPCLELIKNTIEAEKQHHGQLKVSFNHYFFEQDRGSRLLAESSMCANDQGKKHFRSYVQRILAGGVAAVEESIYNLASELKLNQEEFKNCVVSRKHGNLVNDHLRFSKLSGVRAQPTALINGEVVEGPISKEALDRMIQDQVNNHGDSWFKVTFRKIKNLFS